METAATGMESSAFDIPLSSSTIGRPVTHLTAGGLHIVLERSLLQLHCVLYRPLRPNIEIVATADVDAAPDVAAASDVAGADVVATDAAVAAAAAATSAC